MCVYTRVDRLVEERFGGSGINEVLQRLHQLLTQPRLQRTQRPQQLDDFDKHPDIYLCVYIREILYV